MGHWTQRLIFYIKRVEVLFANNVKKRASGVTPPRFRRGGGAGRGRCRPQVESHVHVTLKLTLKLGSSRSLPGFYCQKMRRRSPGGEKVGLRFQFDFSSQDF